MSEINSVYSFATMEEINGHHATYGNTEWAGTDTPAEQQAALRAQRWLNTRPYVGQPTSADQPGPWPRTGVTVSGYMLPSDVTPADLIAAQAEAALLELLTPGVMTPTVTKANIKREKKITGSEVEYFSSGVGARVARYTVIDGYLAPYLRSGNEVIRS